MKKKLNKKQWQDFVNKNCFNSYSLVVVLSVLTIWEAGCKTKDECHKELTNADFGLSGVQAGMAISFALAHQEPDWLDKDMIKVSRLQEEG